MTQEAELHLLRVALGRIKDLPHAAPEALAEIAREALADATPIDAANKWGVSAVVQVGHGAGQHWIMVRNPPAELSPDNALLLAAWLVKLAKDKATHAFEDVLEAVQNA